MIRKKMVTNINMLRPRVLHWVVGDLDRTLIIAEERDFLHIDAIVLEGCDAPEINRALIIHAACTIKIRDSRLISQHDSNIQI